MVLNLTLTQGKHPPQPTTQDRKPAIQMDFAFMSTKEQPGTAITIFTGVDVRKQMAMAVPVPSKSVNRYGLTEFKRSIYEAGRTQAIIQCDDEHSVKAIRRATIQEIKGLTGRRAPTISSQTHGSIERWHKTLFNLYRKVFVTLKLMKLNYIFW